MGTSSWTRLGRQQRFFISGALPVYSFFTLPLFTALFMADAIVKDFRVGVINLLSPTSIAEVLDIAHWTISS
jgi:hypothetical protein